MGEDAGEKDMGEDARDKLSAFVRPVTKLVGRNDPERIKKLEVVIKRRNNSETLDRHRRRRLSELSRGVRLEHKKLAYPITTLASIVKGAMAREKEKGHVRRVEAHFEPRVSSRRMGRPVFVWRLEKKTHSFSIYQTLKELRLTTFGSGVLLPWTSVTQKQLQLVKNHVQFGPLSRSTWRQLLTLHGSIIHEGVSTFLKSNLLIEKCLGHLSLYCIEDLITHLDGQTELTEAIAKSLAPFELCHLRWPQHDDPLGRRDGAVDPKLLEAKLLKCL